MTDAIRYAAISAAVALCLSVAGGCSMARKYAACKVEKEELAIRLEKAENALKELRSMAAGIDTIAVRTDTIHHTATRIERVVVAESVQLQRIEEKIDRLQEEIAEIRKEVRR